MILSKISEHVYNCFKLPSRRSLSPKINRSHSHSNNVDEKYEMQTELTLNIDQIKLDEMLHSSRKNHSSSDYLKYISNNALIDWELTEKNDSSSSIHKENDETEICDRSNFTNLLSNNQPSSPKNLKPISSWNDRLELIKKQSNSTILNQHKENQENMKSANSQEEFTSQSMNILKMCESAINNAICTSSRSPQYEHGRERENSINNRTQQLDYRDCNPVITSNGNRTVESNLANIQANFTNHSVPSSIYHNSIDAMTNTATAVAANYNNVKDKIYTLTAQNQASADAAYSPFEKVLRDVSSDAVGHKPLRLSFLSLLCI